MKAQQLGNTLVALFGVAFACATAMGATDIRPRPGAMQPGGDPLDTTCNWGKWWGDLGDVTQEFDTSRSSSNTIAGSIHVTYDCYGGPAWDPVTPKSANLAFGNFLDSLWGDNTWLGAGNQFDASQYSALEMDVWVDTTVSSNTAPPLRLYGYNYENIDLHATIPITNSGWQHLVFTIPSTINLKNCTAYGIYDWYNTTASTPPAHVEYWFDNVRLVARSTPPPPPTLSVKPMPRTGLLIDSGPGEDGPRGTIDTVMDVRWLGYTTPTPVTYSMTVGSIPDPAVYSNYEANIWLTTSSGVGNPDWNNPDTGWLQIHSQMDGTALAQMVWKTNSPFNNTMFWNEQDGGEYGTNGYAAGHLASFTAPTMVGTWSITFTSDADFTVQGPGGVSTNFSLPPDWIDSWNAAGFGAAYAYFGGSANGALNSGQPMFLDNVAVTGGAAQYNYSNDFSSVPLDTAVWQLLGTEVFVVPWKDTWWLSWTLPAANFELYSAPEITGEWTQLTGNPDLPVTVNSYTAGTNGRAIVPALDLGDDLTQSYFRLQKLVAAKLQVLLPGETNAPGTATGKIGTPDAQTVGFAVPVTINAVDPDWHIVPSCTDVVNITSTDSYAYDSMGNPLPLNLTLAAGTATLDIIFGTSGSQTVTATDTSQPSVAAGTSAPLVLP